jgi:gamma-glutamyltranspeptidase/glutathione hydrolase
MNQSAIRDPVFSAEGVVASPHYLASLAGIDALRAGGSAVDAAIAANAVLAVVWPHMCGVGGDLFAQVWSPRDGLVGLNASGPAGAMMSIDGYRELGLTSVPGKGPRSVTVPGAVDGWSLLHGRWGRLGLAHVLEPAIRHAREGFGASPRLCAAIGEHIHELRAAGADALLPGGDAPTAGARIAQPELAATLAEIARVGRSAVYGGEIGRQIVADVRAGGGLLTEVDLASYRGEWVTPLSLDYRDATICELPPNSSGVVLLETLALLETAPVHEWVDDSVELIDQLVLRKLVAFGDRDAYLGDAPWPSHVAKAMREPGYVGRRLIELGPGRNVGQELGRPHTHPGGDTVYLCAADRDGLVISLIQSIFATFGSGLLTVGGFFLHNRGASFSFDSRSPNALIPGKRPRHTLMPGLALRRGKPWLAFGTRGADGQPQTALQILVDLLDFRQSLGAVVEAPRWVHGVVSGDPNKLVLEGRFSEAVAGGLRARGWPVVTTTAFDDVMGTVQLLEVLEGSGCYSAVADPRGDSVALAL